MGMNIYLPTHEITPLTMAILPKPIENGYLGSLILEENEEFIVNSAPSKLVDVACKFFGSSLHGRQTGTKEVSQMTHKLPISIDPASGMYFFPTTSPNNPNCAWIAHTHIESVDKAVNQQSRLNFRNGEHIIIDVSFGSLMNQINRTAQYRYILDNRLERLQSHYSRPNKKKLSKQRNEEE